MGTIRISEEGTTLEIIGIEVNIIEMIEETSRTEIGSSRIKAIEEDLVGIEETVNLGIEVDPLIGIKVKREGVITEENQDIL